MKQLGENPMQIYLAQKVPPSRDTMFSRGNTNVFPDEPARGRNRPEAQEFAARARDGSGVASIFREDLEISGQKIRPISAQSRSRKQSKLRQNFVAKNRRGIEKIQEGVQAEKEREAAENAPKPLWKSEKYKDVGPKVPIRSQSAQRIRSVEPIDLDVNEEGDPGKLKNRIANHPIRPSTAQTYVAPNFLKRNATSAGKARIKRSPSLSNIQETQKKREEDFQKNYKIGSVPKYLTSIKAELKKKENKGMGEKSDCPPGHILLPNDEKLKTLEMLQTAEKELTSKLNHLPIRTDTTFLRRRKADLQQQIEEVEEAIKIFSKPKVFVKNDQQRIHTALGLKE